MFLEVYEAPDKILDSQGTNPLKKKRRLEREILFKLRNMNNDANYPFPVPKFYFVPLHEEKTVK